MRTTVTWCEAGGARGAHGIWVLKWSKTLHWQAAAARQVVSDTMEQWSPHTEPPSTAAEVV